MPLPRGFYSRLSEFVAQNAQKAGTPSFWRNQLKAAGVPEDEIRATGLGDFLARTNPDAKLAGGELQFRPLEVQQHIGPAPESDDFSPYTVQEAFRGESGRTVAEIQQRQSELSREVENIYPNYNPGRHYDPAYLKRDLESEAPHLLNHPTVQALFNETREYHRALNVQPRPPENYREFAFILPEGQPGAEFEGAHIGGRGSYVHMRTTDRDLGGRSLHIEEVQSDLFQQARESGFRDEAAAATRRGRVADVQRRVDRLVSDLESIHGPRAWDIADGPFRNRWYAATPQWYREQWNAITDIEAADPQFLNDLAYAAGLLPVREFVPFDQLISRFGPQLRQALATGKAVWNDPRAADLKTLSRSLYDDPALRESEFRPPWAPGEKKWPEQMLRNAFKIAADEGYDSVSLSGPEAVALAEGHSEVSRGIQEFYGTRLPTILSRIAREIGSTVETVSFESSEGPVQMFLVRLAQPHRERIKTARWPLLAVATSTGAAFASAAGDSDPASLLDFS